MAQVSAKGNTRRNLMLEGNLWKVIPIIALPQVITMIVDSLYNLADTFFVSQLGDAAVAAVGVNDSLMQIIRSIALAFGMGAASYISRLLGARRDDEASRASSTMLFSAVGFISILAVFGYIFMSPMIDLFGATETSKQYSIDYAVWTLIFCPFTAATVCLAQTLRAEGSSTLSMVGQVSGCVLNCVLDPLFIITFKWGVAGAAIATGVSKAIGVVILLYPYFRKQTILRLSLRLFTPKKSLFNEMARMGIPTGLRSGMMVVANIIINNLAGGYGDFALAAVSVANKCMRLVGSAIMGFGQGFQPIGGFCWGAKKYRRVKQAFTYTSIIGITLGTLLGIILAIYAKELILVFTDSDEMLDIGMVFIRTQCYVLPMHVWVMVASGLFQATGKAVRAGFLGLSRQIFALIPSVLILNALFGLMGLAYSQAVADVVSTLLALACVIPMYRELNKLQAEQDAIPESERAEVDVDLEQIEADLEKANVDA